MDAKLILIGTGCLVCLTPLAVYLLYLSHVNGRPTPTLVTGSWDFAALLLGLSGFVLLAGPLMIALVDSVWRSHAYGGWANLKAIGRGEARAGSLMAVGYLFILLGGIPLLLRWRRHITALYNVNAATVEAAVQAALDELGYPWHKAEADLAIGVKRSVEHGFSAAQFMRHETARVRIEPFPATGHATLRWDGDWASVRPELEAVLPRMLVPHRHGHSAVAGWFFTAALVLMILMVLWLVVLIYLIMTPATR